MTNKYAIQQIVSDELTNALHPEFGYEWREPDGIIYKAIRQARIEELAQAELSILREARLFVNFCVTMGLQFNSNRRAKHAGYLEAADFIKHMRLTLEATDA